MEFISLRQKLIKVRVALTPYTFDDPEALNARNTLDQLIFDLRKQDRKSTTPKNKWIKVAELVIAPLLNPEPHPLQREWSDKHSMTSEQMVERLAQAIQNAVEQEIVKYKQKDLAKAKGEE